MSSKINLFQRIGKTYNGQKIPRGTKWTYSVLDTFRDAAYALMSAFVIVFAKEAGIIDVGSAAILGAISAVLIAFRVFDAVNMSNTVEYNEYKFGDRQESIIFSFRPFSTKLSSSLKEGVVFVALLTTGINKIEGEIGKINDSPLSPAQKEAEITKVLQTVNAGQVWGLKLIMVILPLLCIVACYLLIRKYYFIDEKYYKQICAEIEKRNQKSLKVKKAK